MEEKKEKEERLVCVRFDDSPNIDYWFEKAMKYAIMKGATKAEVEMGADEDVTCDLVLRGENLILESEELEVQRRLQTSR